MLGSESGSPLICPGVVPVLVGPLQVLLTILPGLLVAMLGGIVALFKPSGMKNLVKLLWQQKLAVVLLALVVSGAVYGYRSVWSSTSTGPTQEAQQGTDWTTARFDLRRTGAVPGTPSPTMPKLIWSFKKENTEGFLSSPAVVGNRVYIASVTRGAFQRLVGGKIWCLDADTGKVAWSSAPEDFRPTFSSPVVAGDYLVCGEGLHDTRDARVVCLDIRPEMKGAVVWTFATKNHVECTPVVANGKVYVGAGDDGYYCLDLKPDANGQPKVLWHLPGEQYPDAETSLAVHEGKVYAGLGNAGQALCVLDAETGKELQRLPMPYPVFSPPSIANGKIYLGMGKGDYINLGEGGEVRCLNLKTLQTEWTFPLEQTVLGAVAVKEDKLYFGSRDGYLYCLARNGKQVGKFKAHAPIVTSPAVTDQAVYVVTEAGLLFALDRHTLEPLWNEFRLGTEPLFISSPVVARGHVYVGTEKEGFLCVGDKGEEKQKTLIWANPLGGPGRCGTRDLSPIPPQVTVYWRFPDAEGKKDQGPMVPTSIACLGEDLFVPFVMEKKTGIACIPRESKPDATPEPRWVYETSGPITQPPVVLDDQVFFINVSQDYQNRYLQCLDRIKGVLRWKKEIDLLVSGILTVTNEHILVPDKRHMLSCLDRQGHNIWSTDVGGFYLTPATSNSLVLVSSFDYSHGGFGGGRLADMDVKVLDHETGAILWQKIFFNMPYPVTSPFIGKNVFYLGRSSPGDGKPKVVSPDHPDHMEGVGTGFEAYSLLNGEPIENWQGNGGPPSAEFAVRDREIYYVNLAGELVIVDRETRQVKTKLAGAMPGIPPLVSRGQAIVATDQGLALVALDQEKLQMVPWFDWEDFGPPIAPMVLHDSRIYYPTKNHGLICLGSEK
jgi:outer membrane protein assembly factor BamB